MTKGKWTVAVCAALLWSGTALAAPTAQQKCDKARMTAWKGYRWCVQNVLVKVAGGGSLSNDLEFGKCRHRYFSYWGRFQTDAALGGSTCIGNRFTDNGDGTVTDNLSELVWEKKTDDGSVHDKDNPYTWSQGAPYEGNGTAFTSFVDTLNSGGGFAGANGWRLPTLAELQTIVLDFPCTAASCTCPSVPCVDPALDASTTQFFHYWSATSYVLSPSNAWLVTFGTGTVGVTGKTFILYVRAVRGGL